MEWARATQPGKMSEATVATVQGYPALSERSRGWLRYLHRKATTPDNWDKDGQPHPHWDNISGRPLRSWYRFDLTESCYAMGLMADTTPAWREPYGTILDELAYRHTGWWAAEDWLTQIGDDPKRDQYPEEWYQAWIPPFLRGRYDTPGWTADGVEPWGRQIDPIQADGALWFGGFYLNILGLHHYVTGDDKWNEPFEIIRVAKTRSPGPTPASPSVCSNSGQRGPKAVTARTPRSGPIDWAPRASV